MSAHRFFFKYCRNGHMLYSPEGPIASPRCERCGEAYLESCESCDEKLENSFISNVFLTNRKPTNLPKRPEFCRKCGKPHPWTNAIHKKIEATGIWSLMHPRVVEFGKPRFEAGHYADAVESVFKELNTSVQALYKIISGEELDGVALMRKALTPSKPVIVLDDLQTETGRNIQQGYMELFAGSMAGIRNPKAHGNIDISAERAAHHLMLASLLFSKLDERR